MDNQIKIGDKFKTASGIWEVTGLKPGGKVELFERSKSLSSDRWHREVKTWERVK